MSALPNQSSRLDFRISPEQKSLIERAARAMGQTVSGFATTTLLRAAGERQVRRHCESRVGQVESVLVERAGMGRTEQFVPIAVPGVAQGQVLAGRATGVTQEGLLGEAVRSAA